MDALIAPWFASTAIAQTFADELSTIIIGLDAAATAVPFESEARVILAVDRALVPLWVILCVLGNMKVIQYKVKVHPAWIMLFFIVGIALLMHIYFFPLIPNADAITRSHQSYYRLMSSGPLGFSVIHGFMSLGLVLGVTLVLNAIIRFRDLVSAHYAWVHGPNDD